MARDDWRLRIELGAAGTGGLLSRLGLWSSDARELADELKDHRLAVTEDNGTVFIYASSSLELEQAKGAIEEELRELDTAPTALVTEHWLEAKERWDDEPPAADPDAEVLARGYAPWEVRIPARDHRAARELADRLEAEGYGVVRRWSFVIAGCATEEQARELAARLDGEVEPGGELVWEGMPGNPFAIFGGFGDTGGPI
ncbi:MAG: hypothetical protein H0X39_20015 [Actinobacteria bacterium]|nr:hypothetical protein [Actinomycetota bacterium]